MAGVGSDPSTDGHLHSQHGTAAPVAGTGVAEVFGLAALSWLLMIMAMMLPVVVPLLYRVVVDSVPRRRVRAVSLVLAGYVSLWSAAGLVALLIITPVLAALRPLGEFAIIAPGVIMLLVAAGYELSPLKRRALRRCAVSYRLPPRGAAADRACLRAGLHHGTACLTSCAALMAVLLVAGHANLALLGLITALVWTQRLLTIGQRLRWWGVAALVAAAILVAVG
jgi:predicted metal-binding membrane protein